ncbi:Tn3 transposase DDE domain-containing protein [Rhizobium sp. BK376]|nr:Tn3 transposase DDE domain-containing protein [Rhizobium sp. BK376]
MDRSSETPSISSTVESHITCQNQRGNLKLTAKSQIKCKAYLVEIVVVGVLRLNAKRQRYREGQEDQLGALGLVVNLVVLWNTIYMDAAIDQLVSESYEVRPEDVARLSPLSFRHINMLGRYAFTLPEFVARGELRPLRDPKATDPDDEP